MLDWGGVPHADNPQPRLRRPLPLQRGDRRHPVAGLVVAPNLVPAAITTTRAGGMPEYWFDAMEWLRTNDAGAVRAARLLLRALRRRRIRRRRTRVMNWWDQGYWIVQTGASGAGQQPDAERRRQGGDVPDRHR